VWSDRERREAVVTFKLAEHQLRLVKVLVCEVWVGNKMCAVLYPQEPDTIRLISNHLLEHASLPDVLGPPAIHEFKFNPIKEEHGESSTSRIT
jgi:hypothetical protein